MSGTAGARPGQEEPILPPAGDGGVVVAPDDVPSEGPAGPQVGAPTEGPAGPQDGPPTQETAEPDDESGASPLAVTGWAALALVSLALTGVSATALWWMLHAWRTPDSLRATGFGPAAERPTRTFSLLVPARHGEAALERTLDLLAGLDHPRVEVLAIVEHDDPRTQAATAAAERHPDRVRVVVHDGPTTKPEALITALALCRGDVVGVFDPGDMVHPGLLRHVDALLEETGADAVQGGVQLVHPRTSGSSLRSVLDCYFWYRSRLHRHARQGVVPLGGSTVFVRTEVLRQVGGWDSAALMEGCELGVRLSAAGAEIAVAYDPEIVTRREAPGSVRALVEQRTQWDQGFLQVLRTGAWRQLPTPRQRLLARGTLAMPFLQALGGLLVPVLPVLALVAGAPAPVTALTLLPLVPTLVTIAVETAGLADLGRTHGVRIRARDLVRVVLSTPLHQVLLAFAALRAVVRELRGGATRGRPPAHARTHRRRGGLSVPGRRRERPAPAATSLGPVLPTDR